MLCRAHRFIKDVRPFLAAGGLAVIFLLAVGQPIVLAQTDDPLVRRLVQIAIDDKRLNYDRQFERVTPERYRARYNEINARFLQANRELNRRDPKEQDRIRQQKQTLFNIEITPLVQQWEAELKEKRDAKNEKKRQIVSEMKKDSVVAGQLQAKRTRLRQQQTRGQISESDFQAQDKAAEQQIVAMANKYMAAGYGPTFSGLAAHEAEKILKQPPQVAKNSPTVRKPSGAPESFGLTFDQLLPHEKAKILDDQRKQRDAEKTQSVLITVVIYGSLIAIGGVVFFLLRRRAKQGDRLPPLSKNFGTASFAAMELMPKAPLITSLGVFLGKSSEPALKGAGLQGPGAPVMAIGENHTLIVARTRTGKGTRVIIPTLLRYAGSVFVIDPKGENAAITARTRRDTWRQTVHIINPWGVLDQEFAGKGFVPATYNPLDILDRNDPNAVATARRLANAICPVTAKGNDVFWQQNAAIILTAVLLWLADQPDETKTLARAREIVTLGRKDFTEQFLTKMVVSSAFDGAIREMIGNLFSLADQTYTGITANLTMTTDFISDPQLKKATHKSSFNIAEFKQKPTTLYLVIPPDQIEAQKTWLRLMIAAAGHPFRRFTSMEQKFPCMLLIDEFPALGKLQEMPSDIAVMAGYGLNYTLVVQGIDQLKAIYGDEAGAILSNCAYQWYCNVTDLAGAKHLSESLGEATVRTMGASFSMGTSGGGNQRTGESTNYGEKGRRLLTPDEVITLGRDVAIAFQPNSLPMYLKPVDYWNLALAFFHLRTNPELQPLYWMPPLTWDANPYVAGSKGATGPQSGSSGQSQSGPKPRPEGSGSGSAKQDQSRSEKQPPPGSGASGKANGGQSRPGPQPPPGGTGSGSTKGSESRSEKQPPPGGARAESAKGRESQSKTKPPPGGGRSSSGSEKSDQSKSDQSRPKPPHQPPPMGAEEARNVLGVGPKATKDEIQAAYRRLMAKNHPDHEGTTYLAQKINEAKAVLLGK